MVPNLDAAKITTGALPAGRIGSLPTSQITTGTFGSAFIADSAISNIKLGTDISGDKIVAGTVTAARVGVLDATKITTGTLSSATMIPALDASKITTGTLSSASMVPVLDASKVTTGNFAQTRVTNLTADLTTAFSAGVNLAADPGFENANLPLLSGTEYATDFKRSGTRSVKLIGLTGANIEHYFFRTNLSSAVTIPVQPNDTFYFEAWVRGGTGNTKSAGAAGIRPYLYSGDPAAPTLSYPANIADYTGDLATLNAGWNKLSGYYTVPAGGVGLRVVVQCHTSAGTGAFIHVDDMMCYRVTEAVATNKALYNANVPASTVLAGAVPSLDATKITTGVLGTGIIPSLDAAKITTGTLGTAIVPNLDAGKITTGSLADARIPTLAQSKITNLGTDLGAIDTKAVLAQTRLNDVIGAGANLCTNPGFETAASGAFSGAVPSAERPRTGLTSAKFSGTGIEQQVWLICNTANQIQYFPAKAGMSFAVEFWIYGHASNTGNVGTLALYVLGKDSGNTLIDWASNSYASRINLTTALNGVWTKVSTTVTLTNANVVAATAYLTMSSTVVAPNIYYVDDVVVRDVTESVNINQKLYAANDPANTVLAGAVPSLDATKITTGVLGTGIIPSLDAGKITTGSLADARIPSLATSKITTGTFGSAFIADSAISNVKLGTDISGDKIVAGTVAAPRVAALDATKITTGVLGTTIIPSLDAAKITTGSIPSARIGSLPTSQITTGTFGSAFIADSAISNVKLGADISGDKIVAGTVTAARVGNLDGSKITTGTIGAAIVPSLDAAKITTGSIPAARIGSLPTSQITTGTFGSAFIADSAISNAKLGSDISGSKIVAGTVGAAYVAALDASKITTGDFAQARITGLATDLTLIDEALENKINLITDPSFENSSFDAFRSALSAGSTWSYNTNAARVRSGTRSLTCVSNGGYAQIMLTPSLRSNGYIPVTPGQVFYASMWVYAETTNLGNGQVEQYLEFSTTAPGVGINYVNVGGSTGYTKGTWVQVANYGTVPAGSRWMRLYACGVRLGNTANDVLYFDDLELYEVTEANKINKALYNTNAPAVSILTGAVPSLDGSKITGGTVAAARIADLDAAKITTGAIPAGRIGSLPTSQITSGTFGTAFIADSAITGVKTAGLDASKVTTGTMAQAQVTSLSTDLGNRVDYSAYLAFLSGGASNLATNPSFEDTTQYLWSSVANTNATYVRSGTRSVSLTGFSAYVYIALCTNKTAEIHIQGGPSEKYYFEFYVRGDATNVTTGSAIAVNIGIWTMTAAKAGLSSTAWTGLTYNQIGTAGWVKASGYLTVPADSTTAFHRPIIFLPPTATAGKFYFDDVIIENVTDITATNNSLYGANTSAATILTGAVPSLDATKITTGTLGAAIIGAGTIDNTKIASGVDAAKLTTGTLPVARIGTGAITNTYIGSDVDATKLTAGTLPIARIADAAITTVKIGDSQITGAKTAGLDASKITGGTLGAAIIGAGTIDNTKIATGVDATKLTTGTLPVARIAAGAITNAYLGSDVDAAKLTAGTLPIARIAAGAVDNTKIASGVDAAKLTAGTLPIDRIAAGAITTAKIGDSQVTGAKTAGLDGSKITSGTVAQALVTDLTTDLGVIDGKAEDATGVGLNNSSDILELKTTQSGGANSGYSATDTFSDNNPATLNTTNWNVSVTGVNGKLGTNGADAYWVNEATTAGNTTELDYWKTATNSDYQAVTVIVGNPFYSNSGTMYGPVARCDSTRANYVWAQIQTTTLRIYKVVAGTQTQIGSTYFIPNGQTHRSGDVITLEAGTPANIRQFKVRRNGIVVIDATDTVATLSVVGASNRFAGLRYYVYANNGQIYTPGRVAAWSVSDNVPPTYVGSGFRAYKSSGSQSCSNGYRSLPASFFTEEYRTADYTYNAADLNKLTVSISGWYHVEISLGLTINTMVTDMAVCLWKNGTVNKKTGSVWGVTSIINRGPAGVAGSFIIYLQAGDYIQPGYWQTTAYNAAGTIVGDANSTYFDVALINKSLL